MSKIGKTSKVPSVLPKASGGAIVAAESGSTDGAEIESGPAHATELRKHKPKRTIPLTLVRITPIPKQSSR